MGAAFATFAPLRGAMPGDDDSCRRRRVRGRPCLRRPALASPSRRRHGARDHVGRRPPAGRIPANARGHARRRACARRGASACVWTFDLGNPASLRHGSLRLALRGRGMGELSDSRGMRAAPPEPGRGPRVLEGRPCRGARSRRAHRGTRHVCSRRAGRRARRCGNGGGERERRRHRAAVLPYDRGCALGHGVQGGEHARQHGGLQKRALHRLRLRLGAPRRCGELDSLALIGLVHDRRVPDRRARRARGGAHLAPRQASPCEPQLGADRVIVRGRARAAPGRTRGVFRQAR